MNKAPPVTDHILVVVFCLLVFVVVIDQALSSRLDGRWMRVYFQGYKHDCNEWLRVNLLPEFGV